MTKLLFGDNQFFGVNHMSEEKARAQAMKFQDLAAIIKVLDDAYEEGVKTFMCTTHDRVAQVCEHVRANPERYADYEFYPCMPYAHKYANAVTEHGPIEALKKILPNEGAVGALLKSGVAVARQDFETLAQLLLDLGAKEGLRIFADHIRNRYGAEPGFITMNLPMLLDALEEVGVDNPIVCANINKIGFRMCGGLEAYETALATRRFRPVAMSVLASGAIPARAAIEYVCRQPNMEAIVFGASSRGNIREVRRLVDEYARR